MLRNIIQLFLFCSIILLFVSIFNRYNIIPNLSTKCINKKTFEEEQNEQILVSDIFKSMFSNPSTWLSSIGDDMYRQKNKN